MKAVTYLRVSSKEQREQGYSIEAQRKLLNSYARSSGIHITKEFEEVETAKKAGRTQFNQLVSFLKKNRKIKNVLVEKTDRLYRNLRDRVTLYDLGVNIHFVKEGEIIGPDSKSHQKLMHDIKLVMAKNYIDNLSEETSKGMQEKAEQGLWPSFAPLGYLNNRDTKGIDIDFKRARIIRELFEIYSEGISTLRDLTRIASEMGLRTRKGNTVSRSNIHKMLKNPIFIGDFIWKGVYFKGKHNPIISRECFETVQGVLKNRTRPRNTKHKFAFRGLIKCGHCGCSVTSEIKKGKYVYYH
ncbi:MAG: recombinase family protein, partial [Tissierellales bacterium]|nr:recombinase family protein [Tissierellales bacterium]